MLSTKWKRIRLELASTSEFPLGSASRAYFVQLPLNEHGEFDRKAFQRSSDRATFRRLWASEPDEIGQILEADGQLTMRSRHGDDRILDIGEGSFLFGGQVHLLDHGGARLPLRVVSVR